MTSIPVRVPLVSMSMAEGTITTWFIGDMSAVTAGQAICALEAEKATIDVEAPATGTLRHKVAAGDVVAVGVEIAVIEVT
jgi:pyruvate/2-oxoglutarate dehydrogenase complex dihydrolipoamide acyltransferase (E2) component